MLHVNKRIRTILKKSCLSFLAVSLTLFALLGASDPAAVFADQDEETEESSETLAAEEVPEETEESEETEETEESEETSESSETEETEETEETTETSETEETETTESSEETEETEVDGPSGVYEGITIDGEFDDWESVVKVNDVNQQVNACAMVWDGDYIYIYMDEAQQNSASWSGPAPNHDGNFVIKTDLNEVMVVSFDNNGAAGNTISVTIPSTHTVLTTDNGGIQVAFNDDYSTWGEPTLTEIAIPTSAIPDYLDTISFGYYLGETIVADVANLNPDPDHHHNNEINDGSGIVIDGDYHDWDNYPVTTIEYDTAGTFNIYADAKGAIYSNDGLAYVYGVTNNFRGELDYTYGNQFLEFTVYTGGRYCKMMAVLINDDGSLDWDASRQGRTYEAGTHHFALFDVTTPRTTTNINNISDSDIYYGDMYMTVGDYQDRTEFYFDIETVVNRLGVSAADAGNIKVRFHRIGKEPLETSGISTGPLFVVLMASTAAGSYYVTSRKKKKTD